MADLTGGLEKANDVAKDLDKNLGSAADHAERIEKATGNVGGGGAPVMNRSTMSSFASAGTNPNGASAFGGGQFGNQGYSAFGTSPSNVSGAPRMSTSDDKDRYKEMMNNAGKKITGTLLAAAAFMPTTQEAVLAQQLGDRLRFYSGEGETNYKSKNYNALSYKIQGQMSAMGTATSPLDAALAANSGAGMGLLPGLDNFRTTQTKGGVPTGILGSAALVSNLVPGSGLQGGMGAVASLNQASSVNMLRMFGIQVRNADGTQMNDVASVVDQLYKILSHNKGNLTEEDIAVSAMSGNALDSILRQYFGGDENLRQAVLAGMIQKVKGKTLTKESLTSTGGLARGTTSTGNRSTAELKLIQNFTKPVVQGLIGANQTLQGLYDLLGKGKDFAAAESLVAGSTVLETFAGARGGAGGLAMDAISTALKPGNTKAGGVLNPLVKIAGTALAGNLAMNTNPTGLGGNFGSPGVASYSGQTFNGGITINVSSGVYDTLGDPAAFAGAISEILTRAT
jgi:hypothetical protein